MIIDENISEEELLQVMKPKRRRTRPLDLDEAGNTIEPAPVENVSRPPAKTEAKPQAKADK